MKDCRLVANNVRSGSGLNFGFEAILLVHILAADLCKGNEAGFWRFKRIYATAAHSHLGTSDWLFRWRGKVFSLMYRTELRGLQLATTLTNAPKRDKNAFLRSVTIPSYFRICRSHSRLVSFQGSRRGTFEVAHSIDQICRNLRVPRVQPTTPGDANSSISSFSWKKNRESLRLSC